MLNIWDMVQFDKVSQVDLEIGDTEVKSFLEYFGRISHTFYKIKL